MRRENGHGRNLHVLGWVLACVIVLTIPARAHAAFDGSPYRAIDLDQEARAVYGPDASAISTCDHLYCWKASIGGSVQGDISVTDAVSRQYGAGWSVGAVGVGANDWRAINISQLPTAVLPVLEIASDYWYDVGQVRAAIANFSSTLTTTANWYSYRLQRTFKLLQPVVVPTSRSAAEWDALSAGTADASHRDDFLNAAIADYRSQLPDPGPSTRTAISVYTGNPDAWLGAASDPSGFAVVPPRAASVTCPPSGAQDDRCADATYALGHELGHTFGLSHTCDAFPSDSGCGDSIMQYGKPWNATLVNGEVDLLQSSPFFPPASDTTAPTVVSSVPDLNGTNVATSTTVKVQFSEPMAGLSTTTFRLKASSGTTVPATVTYDAANRSATLTPTAALLKDTKYTTTLTGGSTAIRDIAGNALLSKTWTFTTGPKPTISSMSPANLATGVSRVANVTATFSEPVTGVTTVTFKLQPVTSTGTVGAAVAAGVSRNGTTNQWILNPSSTLVARTKYRATLTGGTSAIRDLIGNPLTTTMWSFTTGS